MDAPIQNQRYHSKPSEVPYYTKRNCQNIFLQAQYSEQVRQKNYKSETNCFLKQIDFNSHFLIFLKLFPVQSHIDVDSQSEAGSERGSVNASPFMNAPGGGSIGQGGGGQLSGGTGSLVPGHNGHHYVQPQSLPYHMHHSLIQHLSDLRDLHGGHLPSAAAAAASNQVQGLPLNGVINHHNSNH